jgi:hypothetical protein
MNTLQNNLQIILQTEVNGARLHCEGFLGIPVVNPCFIAMVTPGSPSSREYMGQLRQELLSAFLNLGASAQMGNAPCGGEIGNFFGCHAHGVNICQKLLVLVGDDSTSFTGVNWLKELAEWSQRTQADPTYRILPVFPHGTAVATLLPSFLHHINSAFWTNTITEIVPQILSAVGLTAQDFRIFISYRTSDSQNLAEQLFDALSHHNFDVFLDRFRIPPSVNFPLRLLQELADKSMVLLIESPNIWQSIWTRLEITFAKLLRLGLLSLQLPGGVTLPLIDPDERETLSPGDFDPAKSNYLTQAALERVISQIKHEHGSALIRRREFLREAMKNALSYCGVSSPSLEADGLMRVKTAKDYAVWLTSRPSEVADFQVTHTNLRSSEQGIIIGPAMFEAARISRLDWLSNVSRIRNVDEGQMFNAAYDIARGI